MIGALTAQPGWRTGLLWTCCGAFALATLGWLFPPNRSPFLMGILDVAVALIRSGAFVMVGTVSVVAIMVKGARLPPSGPLADPEPSLSLAGYAVTEDKSKWVPDITLTSAISYLENQSRWRRGKRYLTTSETVEEIREAMRQGKVTAWGRPHPDDDEVEIAKSAWRGAELTVDTSYAFFGAFQEAAHSIRLSKGQLEAAYPPG